MIAGEKPVVRKSPCASCPYRRDVPSGIWHESEYDKLPAYDGDTGEQIEKGALRLFYCHQMTNELCAGWVGCHDISRLAAVRINPVHASAYDYQSPVPLFDSGAEAAAHGKRDIESPSSEAIKKADKITRLHSRKEGHAR